MLKKILLVAKKIGKRWTFPIKRDSSYHQGVAACPRVGMKYKQEFHLLPQLVTFNLQLWDLPIVLEWREPSSQICTSSVSKWKVTFGHKLRYEIKVTFGEICQMNWNVAQNNVKWCCCCCWWWITKSNKSLHLFNTWYLDSMVLTHIDIVLCASVPSAQNDNFQWNWHQKFSTLLWTPLTRWKALSENCATHAFLC